MLIVDCKYLLLLNDTRCCIYRLKLLANSFSKVSNDFTETYIGGGDDDDDETNRTMASLPSSDLASLPCCHVGA